MPEQKRREMIIADISMWLGFEQQSLEEMKSLNPMSEQYRSKWLSAGSFHGMAHALYIFGLRSGLLSVDDFTKEFLGSAA